MEYFRDPKNQIYANTALRLGKIVTQYEKMSVKEEKYEATLYLAVLQNLMTNCNEYVRNMTYSAKKDSIFKQMLTNPIWGINESCWIKNTFEEKHNLQNFITRIRNSVSHPTNIDLESEFPSTGFTTIEDNSRIIQKFRFINSPDTTRNRNKEFQNRYEIERYILANQNELPKDISYSMRPKRNNEEYYLVSNDKEFARISIIDLTVQQLGDFVKNLSNYLAQPIQENWDGITVRDLIAA